MNEEELFCKLFPDYVYKGKPLSPYIDFFAIGYEQAENHCEELEKENAELKTDYGVLSCSVDDFGELQDKHEEEQRKNNGLSVKLANAVLIIKKLLHLWEDVMTEDAVKSMIKEAKRFLKENEQ